MTVRNAGPVALVSSLISPQAGFVTGLNIAVDDG